jgi:hypothetical protein
VVPILFAPSATSFATNGIGRLSDAISGKVIEELNGQYELEMTYPMGGKYFKDITYSSIIVAKPFQNGALQAFRVYKISKPAKGTITIYARHITYQLNYIPCSAFSGQTCASVLANIKTAVAEYCPFTFTTDIVNTKTSISDNLLNSEKTESDVVYGRIDGNGQLQSDPTAQYVYIKCEASKKYVITKKAGKTFSVATTERVPKSYPLACNNIVTDNTGTKIEYTTNGTAQYLVAYIYTDAGDGEDNRAAILNSLTIKAIGTYTWMLYEPKTIRSFLLGSDDSIQSIYGGEFEWDNYNVKLLENRGANKGVSIRYGKNLIDLTQEENIENTITGIYPVWKSDGTVVELSEKVIHSANANKFPFLRTEVHDFTGDFDVMPTEEELREMANLYIQKEEIGVPEVNLTVNFVNLSETEEYKDILELQTVNMGDTITVEFPALGVSATQKVTKTEYDFFNERYSSITIGNTVHTLADTIEEQMNELSQKVSQTEAQNSIDRATGVMNAGRRGHVIISRNDDGFANELYFLDNENLALAKNILRINVNGIGFSSEGIRGPYYQAWTLDGHLSLGGVNNNHGTLTILDSDGTTIGSWDNNGINSLKGTIRGTSFHSSNDEFYVEENGEEGVEVGWSGWDVWNRIMQSKELGWTSNNFVNPASSNSAAAAMNGSPASDGQSNGYPGTAAFQALWLDNEWFEGESSPWSYNGRGSDSHHLWDVAEVLQWLDSRVTYLEQHQGGGGEGDGSSCGSGGGDGDCCSFTPEGDVIPCSSGDGDCCSGESSGDGNCCSGESSGDGNCCSGESGAQDGPGC